LPKFSKEIDAVTQLRDRGCNGAVNVEAHDSGPKSSCGLNWAGLKSKNEGTRKLGGSGVVDVSV